MNLLKKLIRLVLKVPATFVVVPFALLMIAVSYAVSVVYWIYEVNKWDVLANREARSDMIGMLREWFTTI